MVRGAWLRFAATATLCLLTTATLADNPVAHLLAPRGGDDPALSRAFLSAGFDVKRQVWNGVGPMPDLVAPKGARVVIHARSMEPSAAETIVTVARRIRGTGASEVLIVTESCGAWPEGTADLVIVAPRMLDNGSCAETPPLAEVLRAVLDAPGSALEVAEGAMMRGSLSQPLVSSLPKRAAPVVIGTASAIAATPVSPLQVTPVALSTTSTAVRPSGLQVRPVTPTANLLSAVQTPDGLPSPSIIVGVIRDGTSAEAVEEAEDALAGSALETDTYDARERMRQSDPEGYPRLVAAGAFDPAPATLPTVLQRVLQRMECYRLRIDGDWGRGSRAAVDRYYAERGGSAPTTDASIPLFRDVILREDIVCPAPRPAPVAAAPARTRSTPATTTRTPARSRPAAPVRTAAPRPATPAPAAPTRTNTGRINPTFQGAFR